MFLPVLALASVLGITTSRARSADKPELIEVIANGAGLTAEDALADAFRDAVRQAVGVLVDAKTKIKNDELIEDKVLTLSNGFVKSHTKKSERKEGGLIKIRIEAKVERGKLLEKLTEFKITRTEVDGIEAKLKGLQKVEIKKQATDLLKEALSELPQVMVAEAKNDLNPDGMGQCDIEVKVKIDAKRYATFMASMKKILEAGCESHESFVTPKKVTDEIRYPSNRRTSIGKDIGATSLGSIENDQGLVVWLIAQNGPKAPTARWEGYGLRVDNKAVVDAVKGKILIRVRLLDKDQKTIMVLLGFLWVNFTT